MPDKRFYLRAGLIATGFLVTSCSGRNDCCDTQCVPDVCCSVLDEAPCLQECIVEARESKRLPMLQKRFDDITAFNVEGCRQGYTPSHLEDMNWLISADVIYAKPSMDGLQYAAKVGEAGSNLGFHERLYSPHFEWDWGFRLGAGMLFPCHEDWDLTAQWTYYQADAKSAAKAGATDLMFPLWGGQDLANSLIHIIQSPLLGDFATKARSRWRMNLNIADIEVGRDFFISKAIAARPFISARGVDYHQYYSADYDAEFVTTGTAPLPTASTEMRSKEKFLGIGPRIGTDLLWHINCDWGISCKLAAALFYGKFDVKQRYFGDRISSANLWTPFTTTYIEKHWRIESELDASIGLQWESFFNSNRSHVLVALSYELSEWFHMNRLTRTSFATGGTSTEGALKFRKEFGDLGIQGTSLKIRFDF